MRPTKRRVVNKHRSAGKFRHHVGKTKALNMAPRPMRGGFRI